uniref:Uncharacterized protein n=1 Tax=Lepeophtheirus salmonis TaxID=72036 RepID=A0A0K2UKW2_LEPSM
MFQIYNAPLEIVDPFVSRMIPPYNSLTSLQQP